MAIRRCPYCKAIIDESQKYCNNCGTQLLFPQDEAIEEDIKGEKIRDADFRDAETDESEFEKSLEPSDEEASREEIDLEKILEGSASFPDDMGVGDTDEAEPTPEEPIIKPLPKMRAVPKPKISVKSKPEPMPPEKPGPAPVSEIPPVAAVEETPAPPIPAAPPSESQAEAVRRSEPPAGKMVEDGGAGPGDVSDEIAKRERKPETEDEAGEEIEEIEEEEEAEEIEEPDDDIEEDEDEDEEEDEADDEAGGEDETEDVLEKEAEALAGDLDEVEILPKKKAPTVVLPPAKTADDLEYDAADEGKDEAGDADSAGPGVLSEADEDRDEAETREEIARLIAALEKKHKKIPLTREEKKIIAPLEETNGLPAWAESSRTGGSFQTSGEEDGAAKDTGGSFAAGDTMDFEEEVMKDAGRTATRPTIGIPETLPKIEIPDREEAEAAGSGGEDEDAEGAEPALSDEGARAEAVPDFVFRRRLGFFGVLRAGIYDLFFVALLWFAAAWLAAGILVVPVKTLIIQAAVPLGLLYGVLLLLYLFLFLFFLGETLGGRLAAPKR